VFNPQLRHQVVFTFSAATGLPEVEAVNEELAPSTLILLVLV
jgi:hypothetical protein